MPSKIYFAYGSNLNKRDWNENGFRPPYDDVFEKIAVAWLPDHAHAFSYRSGFRNGGVLDVVPKEGCVVPGVLFRIKNKKGWDALCAKEGVPYAAVPVTVLDAEGNRVKAITFKIRPEYDCRYAVPDSRYVNIVCAGLEKHKLPTDGVEETAINAPATPLDAFFCYGTLRKGDCRYRVMEELGILSEQPGKVRGRLYDCGAYPAITTGVPKRSVVHGDFLRVADVETAFHRLDAIEGYYADAPDHSLYVRKLVPVRLADRSVQIAWIYEYARPLPKTVITSGDWFKR